MNRFLRVFLCCAVVLTFVGWSDAQYLEDFNSPELCVDPNGIEGWSFFTGDGEAQVDFVATQDGYASIRVDATRDHRNTWWALIKRNVSGSVDLNQLGKPGWELRVEARIRTSHAPRRVNLHANTQRTTDFHSHLMEFDIADAESWHTISMTTRGFQVEPDDTVFAQMALMDWGLARYRVDVDYFKVDVVDTTRSLPDFGEQVPYHPSIPDIDTFEHRIVAAQSAVIDCENPGSHLDSRSTDEDGKRLGYLTLGETQWIILRWDLDRFTERRVVDHGLLELTTNTGQSKPKEGENRGLVRVVEILFGDPAWRNDRVTIENLAQGKTLDEVFNPQMIIDWPVSQGKGAKTWLTISRPVLQRLVDGRTLGIALKPLGPISASFRAGGNDAPFLMFNIEE